MYIVRMSVCSIQMPNYIFFNIISFLPTRSFLELRNFLTSEEIIKYCIPIHLTSIIAPQWHQYNIHPYTVRYLYTISTTIIIQYYKFWHVPVICMMNHTRCERIKGHSVCNHRNCKLHWWPVLQFTGFISCDKHCLEIGLETVMVITCDVLLLVLHQNEENNQWSILCCLIDMYIQLEYCSWKGQILNKNKNLQSKCEKPIGLEVNQ